MNILARWIPVTLTVIPIVVLWPTLAGQLASAAWVTLIAISRIAAHGKARPQRMGLDAFVLVVCLFGFLFGGLYWVPAAAAFGLVDRYVRETASTVEVDRFSGLGRGALVPLGVMSSMAGLVGIAAFLILPVYSAARSSPTTVGGQSTSVTTSASGLEAGLGPGGGIVVACIGLLFVAIAVGSIAASRRNRVGRLLLGVAGIVVTVISVFGILTIGLFLLPGILLTLLTLWAAFAPSSMNRA